MIYSDDINRICALCQNADERTEDDMFCSLHNKNVSKTDEACKKFVYDIFKKQVRRKKRLKTNFTAEDFTL